MEEHAVTTWVAMSAAVSVVGMVLTALLTWMIVCHLTVSLNVTMVAPVLIEWGHFFAVALQIIRVNYLSHFDIECIIDIMLFPGCHSLVIPTYYVKLSLLFSFQ